MLFQIFTDALPLSLTVFLSTAMVHAFPDVSVPATCTSGFSPGIDTALLTVPYPPSAVLSVVSDFQNLTWSGTDPSNVILNGTDNEPGTAREYSLSGLDVVETLFEYYKPGLDCEGYPDGSHSPRYPPDMTYAEAHTTAQVNFNGNNVFFPFDGLNVKADCFGRASTLNYTASFCANDAGSAQAQLHALHMQDLENVQAMLGNETFVNCNAISRRSNC